jgi:hypothetical protein
VWMGEGVWVDGGGGKSVAVGGRVGDVVAQPLRANQHIHTKRMRL